MYCVFFFFQAEDGIRDGRVTGVQTCALPILTPRTAFRPGNPFVTRVRGAFTSGKHRSRVPETCPPDDSLRPGRPAGGKCAERSEERRVGKEWRSRWWQWHEVQNR